MDGVIRGVSEAIISSSPSAQINRVWIDYGIKLNGNNAMKIHCDFNVLGLQRSQGDMRIWIYDENKQIHQVNGTDQYFSVGFTPAYLDTRYSDCWYAPYIEQLNFKLGQHTYYLCVTINDNNGKQLAQSQLISFTGTGRPPAQPSSPSVTPPVNNSNNETRTPNYRRESEENTQTAREWQHRVREGKVYTKYESLLTNMKVFWERYYDDNLRKTYQRKMKEIRTKWERKGYKMYHSPWEDWDGRI